MEHIRDLCREFLSFSRTSFYSDPYELLIAISKLATEATDDVTSFCRVCNTERSRISTMIHRQFEWRVTPRPKDRDQEEEYMETIDLYLCPKCNENIKSDSTLGWDWWDG